MSIFGVSFLIKLGLVLLFGTVLAAGLRLMRWTLELVPLERGRKEILLRFASPVSAMVLLGYAIGSSSFLFRAQPELQLGAVAVILLGGTIAVWPALFDFASGVVLKAGRTVSVGDVVKIGELSGRVQRMGLRALVLETQDGDEAIVPYARVARTTVVKSPGSDQLSPHSFSVRAPAGWSAPYARDAIALAALHCHWSSLVRKPEISVGGEQDFAVTVYALHPDYASEIEAAVRRAVETERI